MTWHGATIRRTALAGALLASWAPSYCSASPPRFEDDEFPVRPAALAEPRSLEPPQSLSPRTTPAAPVRRAASAEKTANPGISLWGTVVGLGVVFGLLAIGRAWLTRHGPVGFRGLPVEALELLGRKMIEPRVSIHLVRCGPKILVLGVSPDGIRTLTEIADPVEIDLIAGACRRKDASPTAANFAGMFLQPSVTGRRPTGEP